MSRVEHALDQQIEQIIESAKTIRPVDPLMRARVLQRAVEAALGGAVSVAPEPPKDRPLRLWRTIVGLALLGRRPL